MCYISTKRLNLENNTSENSNLTIEQRAISLLETYQGANNYILKLKHQKETNKRFFPTRAQCDYIINYYEVTPKVAKRWVDLDPYFAKKIADEKLLLKIPEQVWVEKLLVEKEKSYHVWGKVLESETIHDFWLPKGALIKTHTIKDVVVDYSKYSNRPPLEHQKLAIEKLAGSKRFILADDMGLGKFFPTKTLIYTPLGMKPIGDVSIGDDVIGSNGDKCKVTGVFSQGVQETYKITFND